MDIVYLVLIWVGVSVVAAFLIGGTLSQNELQRRPRALDSHTSPVVRSVEFVASESCGRIRPRQLRRHLKPAIFLLILIGLYLLEMFEVIEAVVSAM